MKIPIPSQNTILKSMREISLAIIVIGAGLGMYLNFYFGNIGWNNFLMLFALIFIPNWKNLLSNKLYTFPNTIKFILFFQLFVIIYMILANAAKIDYVYTFFTIIFIVGLSSSKPGTVRWERVIYFSWILGWICLILCIRTIITGAYFIEYAHSHDGSGYESILVDLTMAGNLINFIACCLYFIKTSNRIKVKFSILGIFLSLLLIFILGKRTPLILAIILIILYIYRFNPPSRYIKKSTLYFFIGIILGIFILFQIPVVHEMFFDIMKRTISGVLDLLNGTSNSGMAAVERYYLRNWAFNYIDNRFYMFNYVLGAGYMTKWLDAPLLQAFLDLGIIGFLFYLYLVIIKPLKIIFSPLDRNPIIFWGTSLCLYNILSAMNSGHPYSHLKWIPIIILFLILRDYKYKEQYTIIKIQNSI
ncbi:MAG: hypothetical protein HDR09_18195 [Lachnospiraceae bacterium]|nr:hypothetical protein [Lachnospiraceae bacterium]